MILGLDLETYSAADLKRCGAAAYAQHWTTDVHCAAYAFSDGPKHYEHGTWLPGQPVPTRVRNHIESGGAVLAHNAPFEASMLTHVLGPVYGWPLVKAERWLDTAVLAGALNLPTSLAGLGAVLGAKVQKDDAGHELMLQLCKVLEVDGTWQKPVPTEGQLRRLVAYCATDVQSMLACWWRLQQPTLVEWKLIAADCAINSRGVFVDQQFAHSLRKLAQAREHQIEAEVAGITGDVDLKATSAPGMKRFLQDAAVELPLVTRKRKGGVVVKTETVGREATARLVVDPTLDDQTRRVLSARVEATRATSLAKLARVPQMVNADGRLRFALSAYAAVTGRWASRGLQLHNLPKIDKRLKGPFDAVRAAALRGDLDTIVGLTPAGMTPMQVLSNLLRSVISAPKGYELIGGDYSAIEARVLCWLAGETNKVSIFRRFDRTAGLPADKRLLADPYVIAAKNIGSNDRQLGKVQELALGYGMGEVKFAATAAGYGVTLELKRAREIKIAWRERNARIVTLWADLESGALEAMNHPRREIPAGPHMSWTLVRECLQLRLPSVRTLHYWRPRVRTVVRRFETVNDAGEVTEHEGERQELQFFTEASDRRTMVVEGTYGGKLAENATQAVARDLLAAALVRLHESDYPVVLHVHDSVVSEVPEGTGDVDEFCALLAKAPPWATDLPIAVEGYRSNYFRG